MTKLEFLQSLVCDKCCNAFKSGLKQYCRDCIKEEEKEFEEYGWNDKEKEK